MTHVQFPAAEMKLCHARACGTAHKGVGGCDVMGAHTHTAGLGGGRAHKTVSSSTAIIAWRSLALCSGGHAPGRCVAARAIAVVMANTDLLARARLVVWQREATPMKAAARTPIASVVV